jgi:tripeptidyl-peptidase-1
VRADEYSLPDILLDHVESVFNVVQFPGRRAFRSSVSSDVVLSASSQGYVTPALLNSFYSILNNTGNPLASQAVVGINDETLSSADLTRFQKEFKMPQKTITSNTGGHVVSTACMDGTSCSDANLDVQYLMAVSQNTPTSFMYWNGTDFWLDWITSVAEMTNPPLVVSISYVQNEHDVSQSYADAFNFEAMKLSLAGVTLVVASGDDGAAGLDAREDVMRCGFFPQFPATSPYVTSIGATKVVHV